jgi:addiction module HigA family antidote
MAVRRQAEREMTLPERRICAECVHTTHPGAVLRAEFLEPLDITAYRLAQDISVPLTRITKILAGERAITADTALRLGRYFGMSPQFWLVLQNHHDLDVA